MGSLSRSFSFALGAGIFVSSACSQITPLSSQFAAAVSADPEKIVCDPLDPKNSVDPELGIKASLSYLESYIVGGPYPVTSSADLILKGKKLDATLYLGDLNVTPRDFDRGFVSAAGDAFKKQSGEILNEWFAIQGETQIQLGPNEEAGAYQLAAIVDDGITVDLRNSNGDWSTVISDETPHSARARCSSVLVRMQPGKVIPMRFRYYQGPRVRVALMLVWRKVNPDAFTAEAECANSPGDDYFFRGNPSVALSPYLAMVSRGWKPLAPANYLIAGGANLCAGVSQAPD